MNRKDSQWVYPRKFQAAIRSMSRGLFVSSERRGFKTAVHEAILTKTILAGFPIIPVNSVQNCCQVS